MIQVLRGAGRAMTLVSIVLMLVIAIPIAYEAVARAFGAPTIWVFETTLYLFIFLGFLGNSLATSSGAHFRVMMLPDLFPSTRRFFDLVSQIATLLFSLVLIYAGLVFALSSYSSGIMSGSMLDTPLWLPQLALPLGGIGLFIQTLVQILTGESPVHTELGD